MWGFAITTNAARSTDAKLWAALGTSCIEGIFIFCKFTMMVAMDYSSSFSIQTRMAKLLWGLLALPATLAGAVAQAQTASPAVPTTAQTTVAEASAGPVFQIRGFNVTGDNPLSGDETSRVLAPFLRSDATLDTLQKATQALETAMKAKGFALHKVALPPQEIGATVNLNVVKFVIGKVVVEGAQNFSEANIRNSLPELKEGTAPNFRTLAVQTAIANENPSRQMQVGLKEAEEVDQIDAKVVVKDAKPWNFSVSAANTGSNATGNDRLTLAGSHTNLWDRDHSFTGAYTTSLERPADVKQLGLNYRVPFYAQGGVLGLSYTRSDVVGNFGAFTSTGAGSTFGLNYSHYLPPDGGYRSYFTVGVDDKLFNASVVSGAVVGVDRRSRPLTLGYNARVESDSAVWGYNADLSLNLPGGNGNDLASYTTEDPRISGANFKILRAGANYLTGFGNGWLASVRGSLQYSPDALISGEQFGLGGSSSVRGTGERPISADSGLFISTEISSKELMPGLRVLGFIDAGWLANNNPNGNPKPASDSLAGAGIGLRFNSPAGYSVTVDYGRIVSGSQLPFVPGSAIPQVGDQKFHINFTARF